MAVYDSSNVTDATDNNPALDINNSLLYLYRVATQSLILPSDRLTKEERIAVVRKLQKQGFFKLKGAVPYTAKHLHCSSASIYIYLNELKNLFLILEETIFAIRPLAFQRKQ